MGKKDLEAGENWWQISNSTTGSKTKTQNENKTEIWIKKGGFETGIRLKISLKNSRNILE